MQSLTGQQQTTLEQQQAEIRELRSPPWPITEEAARQFSPSIDERCNSGCGDEAG